MPASIDPSLVVPAQRERGVAGDHVDERPVERRLGELSLEALLAREREGRDQLAAVAEDALVLSATSAIFISCRSVREPLGVQSVPSETSTPSASASYTFVVSPYRSRFESGDQTELGAAPVPAPSESDRRRQLASRRSRSARARCRG